ncbi:hypothetical protein [Longimicrobium terrae]|uniref:Uncharacterized protein n=1 Tax=Longimicrobium terrae TaxID=1639882 RepID=A0A841GWE2_9BACT|nr:hypothetical protein [Longimicrobium terrae]MBB4635962.1 hypothetical protein [Longimicrobium terrae]MBB6070358.1 hypothetical protein [Longimicrobium terrae]NNC30855.1 hypothetical protein [Longimicrobium terrae]
MTSSSTPPGFRLARGPRILARTAEAEVPVAEFPASGNPALDALRPVFARLCLAALSSGFSPDGSEAAETPPLELLGLALTACDEADVAFAVLNINDGLTPQARRALGEAWALVQEAIGARRGADSVHAEAARENRALLRGCVAADAVDRYVAALSAGADPGAAREAAVAAAIEPPAALDPAVETVWDLARECVTAWPQLGGEDPLSGADVVEWLAGMRDRFRRALQFRPR